MKDPGILVVDVGTTKVCALIGEFKEGDLWITGIGLAPSFGLKKGIVIDIDEATASIHKAIETALNHAKVDIDRLYVYTSIAGSHIKMCTGMGIRVLKQQEVTLEDIQDVIETAQNTAQTDDEKVIHALPKEYIIDRQRGILKPLGMTGKKLEAHVNLITCSPSAYQNLLKCFERIGVNVTDVIFQGLASAEAVLTPEEKELGVIVIDFGGGTTDVVAYWGGVLRYAFSLPVGGELLTNDLAIGLRTSKLEAERVKREKGVCLTDLIQDDEIIEVPGIGNRPPRKVSREYIGEILEARVKEVFELIQRELTRYFEEEIAAGEWKSTFGSGIVLTGGSALLPGMMLLADQMFDLPTKVGYPQSLNGLTEEINSPQFATAVGMLICAWNDVSSELEGGGPGILDKVKKIFQKLFKGG